MIIREASQNDLQGLLMLYAQLHDEVIPPVDELQALWQKILADPDQHVLLGIQDEKIISTCVLIIVPNLTRGARSYAIIENVVTDSGYRKKGFATAVLNHARDIAQKENCYKIMLMTSKKEESTLRFYEQAGFNRTDKTTFVQWLR